MLQDNATPASLASHVEVRISDVISALSYALDLAEGQPMGHAVNCCVIGMRLAEILQVRHDLRSDLYYALLLKDAGGSANAARMHQIFGGDDVKAKREIRTTDWNHVSFEGLQFLMRNVMPGKSTMERVLAMANVTLHGQKQTQELVELRSDRGAALACQIGFSETTAAAIRALDEHWDGSGFPERLRGDEIPYFARILSLAQTLEVFAMLNGPSEALEIVRQRSGSWFDPEIARAAAKLEKDTELWTALNDGNAREIAISLETPDQVLLASEEKIDLICETFAEIIDGKSPCTQKHSLGVAEAAKEIGSRLNFPREEMVELRRAALLHDLGKLSVPNSILDKPGRLTPQEWDTVRLYPYNTQRILEKVVGFKHMAFVASTHHEKLDGSGYYRNLRSSQLPMTARALAVADMYNALSSKRPWREPFPREKALEAISNEVPHAIDKDCVAALKAWLS
jgi:HD-GYP domain-containing protein (c-di-GMP phosphodiesterase class II)